MNSNKYRKFKLNLNEQTGGDKLDKDYKNKVIKIIKENPKINVFGVLVLLLDSSLMKYRDLLNLLKYNINFIKLKDFENKINPCSLEIIIEKYNDFIKILELFIKTKISFRKSILFYEFFPSLKNNIIKLYIKYYYLVVNICNSYINLVSCYYSLYNTITDANRRIFYQNRYSIQTKINYIKDKIEHFKNEINTINKSHISKKILDKIEILEKQIDSIKFYVSTENVKQTEDISTKLFKISLDQYIDSD